LGFGIPNAELASEDGLNDVTIGCHFRATSLDTCRESMVFIVKSMFFVIKNYNPVFADPG
jgi:hypothetical protein